MFGSVNATAPVVGAVSRNGTSAIASAQDDDALMHPNVSMFASVFSVIFAVTTLQPCLSSVRVNLSAEVRFMLC